MPRLLPSTPLSGSPLPRPTQTAVDSCGVNPQNQAFLFSDVVPVLPAAGRPSSCARVPVPLFTTCSMAYVASAATSELKARLLFCFTPYTVFPARSRTLLTKNGLAATPLLANVAYAE